jgi:hypothetical protein
VRVQVDQHRAVDVPSAQREVVNAEHSHRCRRRVRQAAEEAQQRIPADHNAELSGHPGTRSAGQSQPDRL